MTAFVAKTGRLRTPLLASNGASLECRQVEGRSASSIDWLRAGVWLGAFAYCILFWLALIYGATTILS